MRRHRLDPFSLMFGLLFAWLGLVFLVWEIDVTEVGVGRIWPLFLIFLGLVALVIASRRRRGTELGVPDEQ